MESTIINFFHLLGAVIWIGGALYIHLILMPALKAIDPQEGGKLQGIIAKRFSIVAWSSIVVLIITGLFKTPSAMLLNTTTHFGVILFIKHIFILGAICVGLMIALNAVPNLRKNAPKQGEKPSVRFFKYQKRLHTLALTNLIFALLILVLASMLW
jgi:copper resistance protein D